MQSLLITIAFFLSLTALATSSAHATCTFVYEGPPGRPTKRAVCTTDGPSAGSYGGGGGGGGGNRAGAAAAGIALGLGILNALGSMNSGSSRGGRVCNVGYGVCPDQTCAPIGAVCCGNGRYCPRGNYCTRDNRCVSPAAVERQRQCDQNYKRAYAAWESGRTTLDRWNPGGAIVYYERAIALFSRCNERENVAIVRGYLDEAHKQYAAIRDDDRVAKAKRLYGNVGTTANPFDRTEIEPSSNMATPVRWEEMFQAARGKCGYASENSPQWSQCVSGQMARQILNTVPAIREACSTLGSAAERRKCAIDKYAEASGSTRDPFSATGESNLWGDGTGRAVGSDQSRDKTLKSVLRDRLRAKLAKLKERDEMSAGPCVVVGNECIPTADLSEGVAPTDPSEHALAVPDTANQSGGVADDDPLKAFLRAPNSSGSNNAGDLDMRKGINVGVPEKGSFANDYGGDELSGGHVPSRR